MVSAISTYQYRFLSKRCFYADRDTCWHSLGVVRVVVMLPARIARRSTGMCPAQAQVVLAVRVLGSCKPEAISSAARSEIPGRRGNLRVMSFVNGAHRQAEIERVLPTDLECRLVADVAENSGVALTSSTGGAVPGTRPRRCCNPSQSMSRPERTRRDRHRRGGRESRELP